MPIHSDSRRHVLQSGARRVEHDDLVGASAATLHAGNDLA